MRRVLLLSFLILLSAPALIFAQRDSIRPIFLNAESWFLFEAYSDALPLYESLLKADPGNNNLNYKIGICLLNDPYQKDKAIQYLLEASSNINPSYKENNFKERTAPPDALYYLGNAYLVNELLNRAIESYEEFLEVMDHEVYDEELVLAQIRSCKNAQRLKTMPVDIDLTLIDSLINTHYSDIHPVVSGDGTKLAFVTVLPFYDGAFYTEKREDGWSYPQMITQMMGFDADVYPVALSHDGTEMILYYDDDYVGNLYYSKLEDGLWTTATKMGENISTKFWESHASFSRDGQTLYFTSNRKGTSGGLDIYMSELQPNGKWGIPVNLGTTINTRYNEECPYISEDGQTLYFSSYGHYNMGGYDIFYSKKNKDGTWAEPVNIGYPINTTDDDLFFQPINNGNGAYYSLYSPSGIGLHDIYYMNIYSVNNPRFYSVTGNFRTEDGRIDSTRMAIYVIDTGSGDTLIYTTPTEEGAFAFELKQGIYKLHFKGEGYEELIRPLQINAGSEKEGITLANNIELTLIEEEAELYEGEESKIKLTESQYEGVANVAIIVPVNVPKGSTVIIRTYQDSTLIRTDTIVTEKRKTNLQIVPLPGSSEVELEMTDKKGNIHRNRFTVVGSEPVGLASPQEVETVDIADEQPATPADPIYEDPIGIMMLQLKSRSDSALHDELVRQLLIEQSDGPLKEYLQQLDLEAEGIHTDQELLGHLEKVAEAEGFTMDDVRKAMLESLERPLEVDHLYEELLNTSDGIIKDILESLDLRGEEIYTVDELIDLLSRELEERGESRKEIEKLLSELFGEQYSGSDTPNNKTGWPLLVLLAVAGSGLIWLIIAWWRRREKREKQGD